MIRMIKERMDLIKINLKLMTPKWQMQEPLLFQKSTEMTAYFSEIKLLYHHQKKL